MVHFHFNLFVMFNILLTLYAHVLWNHDESTQKRKLNVTINHPHHQHLFMGSSLVIIFSQTNQLLILHVHNPWLLNEKMLQINNKHLFLSNTFIDQQMNSTKQNFYDFNVDIQLLKTFIHNHWSTFGDFTQKRFLSKYNSPVGNIQNSHRGLFDVYHWNTILLLVHIIWISLVIFVFVLFFIL